MSKTKEEFIEFYQDKFLPIYSDLVAVFGDKPEQLLIEFENISIHLIQYLKSPASAIGKDNMSKAYNHMLRAAIDSYKMLWIYFDRELKNLFNNKWHRRFALNMSHSEFIQQFNKFKDEAKEARKLEMTNVGVAPEDCINLYNSVVEIGWNILKKYDREKAAALDKFKIWTYLKSQLVGFLLGVVASLVTGYFLEAFKIFNDAPVVK